MLIQFNVDLTSISPQETDSDVKIIGLIEPKSVSNSAPKDKDRGKDKKKVLGLYPFSMYILKVQYHTKLQIRRRPCGQTA